jgi:hypothetical protein
MRGRFGRSKNRFPMDLGSGVPRESPLPAGARGPGPVGRCSGPPLQALALLIR